MLTGKNAVLFYDYYTVLRLPKAAKQLLISRGKKTGALIFRKVFLEALFYAVSKGVRYR